MKTNRAIFVWSVILITSLSTNLWGQKYLSPTYLSVDRTTNTAWVLLETDQSLVKVDLQTEQPVSRYPLNIVPGGLMLSADGKSLYVTEKVTKGKLHIFTSEGKTKAEISTGAYPSAVCVDKEEKYAWVTNQFSNDLSQIDLKKRKEIRRIPMIREPRSMALSPDGTILAVGNYLPDQPSNESHVAAEVTMVDTRTGNVVNHIGLPSGAQSVADVCFSKTGDYLYVTHILSRFLFPTTQLERGWMNTNALSIVDVKAGKYYNTVLLDNVDRGAANPCGMTLSEDGKELYIAISGTHELIAVSLDDMHRRMQLLGENRLPESVTTFDELSNNLTFLAKDKVRIPLTGKGARYAAAYNGKIYVSEYFSGQLTVVDLSRNPIATWSIRLGTEPPLDQIRKGELFFADAELCFQNWQSCISCHPGVRTDGLNWDLINDGLGNPKNTKSLLLAHVTPPCMITGIRPNAEIAVRAGIRYIQFADRSEEDAQAIDAYLRSIKPLPSPYLVDGKLSPTAHNGEKIFSKAGCLVCHNGDYYTNGQKTDVGTGLNEYVNEGFDTPTLIEIWRTAPYLYDGRARTIKEVLTIFNKEDKHGKTSNLTEKEIEELEAYILSL